MAKLIHALEAVNRIIGDGVRWLVIVMVVVQFAIVLLRYVFGISYMFLTESVLYMHAALFMLGVGYTLLVDQHVRVDIFYAGLSRRGRALIDLLGGVFLLLPSMTVLALATWPFVRASWRIQEGPISVGGIPASYLLKTLITAFCVLLIIQGIATVLRNLSVLAGYAASDEDAT